MLAAVAARPAPRSPREPRPRPGGARRPRASTPRCLEYVVWTAERGAAGDWPRADEARAWRLDVSAALERKRAAIAAHRSQLGEVITDDPHGFMLAPAMRRRAEGPRECFFEIDDWR